MKAVSANKLKRFWVNGVIPIKNSLSGKVNTSDIVNNFTTTVANKVADARALKILMDMINELNRNIQSANDKALTSYGYAMDNGVISNANLVDTGSPYGQYNRAYMVNESSTNAPPDLAWGIREVLYLGGNTIIVRITGVKKDGATSAIWTNVYNFGHWTGWQER